MNTLVIVLSAVLGLADEPASLWQDSYAQAERMAAQQNKSVAVFLTKGEGGLTNLVPGGLSERAREVLASNYVAVMVDTTTPDGQQLARAFALRAGQGLVLSDRGGNLQAFWYQGTLNNQDLVRNLERYANQTNIRMTAVAGRSSLYPPGDEAQQPSTSRRMGRRVNDVSATPVESQRRIGMRNSERGRLFQGRLSRRNAS